MSSPQHPQVPEPSKGNTTILPPEKVFPIQIGSELFRVSGASISSDGWFPVLSLFRLMATGILFFQVSADNSRAPSYFSQFFEEQLHQNEGGSGVRTLYIDRDPTTFRDILRHLQGAFPYNQIAPD